MTRMWTGITVRRSDILVREILKPLDISKGSFSTNSILHKRQKDDKICFENKIALVTGGASGIGLQCVKSLLNRGCLGVTIADSDAAMGERALKEICEEFGGNRAIYIKCDVTKSELLDWAFKNTLRAYNRLDIVVSNAGILNDKAWEKTLATNVTGYLVTNLLSLQYMSCSCSGHGGTVVNIASTMGISPYSGVPIYSMSQSGIIGLTRALGDGCQLHRTGVSVMALCAGLTDTRLMKDPTEKTINDKFSKEFVEEIEGEPLQCTESVGKALIEVIKSNESGSVWVVENDESPVKISMPDILELKTCRKKRRARKIISGEDFCMMKKLTQSQSRQAEKKSEECKSEEKDEKKKEEKSCADSQKKATKKDEGEEAKKKSAKKNACEETKKKATKKDACEEAKKKASDKAAAKGKKSEDAKKKDACKEDKKKASDKAAAKGKKSSEDACKQPKKETAKKEPPKKECKDKKSEQKPKASSGAEQKCEELVKISATKKEKPKGKGGSASSKPPPIMDCGKLKSKPTQPGKPQMMPCKKSDKGKPDVQDCKQAKQEKQETAKKESSTKKECTDKKSAKSAHKAPPQKSQVKETKPNLLCRVLQKINLCKSCPQTVKKPAKAKTKAMSECELQKISSVTKSKPVRKTSAQPAPPQPDEDAPKNPANACVPTKCKSTKLNPEKSQSFTCTPKKQAKKASDDCEKTAQAKSEQECPQPQPKQPCDSKQAKGKEPAPKKKECAPQKSEEPKQAKSAGPKQAKSEASAGPKQPKSEVSAATKQPEKKCMAPPAWPQPCARQSGDCQQQQALPKPPPGYGICMQDGKPVLCCLQPQAEPQQQQPCPPKQEVCEEADSTPSCKSSTKKEGGAGDASSETKKPKKAASAYDKCPKFDYLCPSKRAADKAKQKSGDKEKSAKSETNAGVNCPPKDPPPPKKNGPAASGCKPKQTTNKSGGSDCDEKD